MNLLDKIDGSHSVFQFSVSGSALRAAILERVERERALHHEDVPAQTPLDGLESSNVMESLISLEFIAANLKDDESYQLSLDDAQRLLTAQQNTLGPLVNNLMVMFKSMLPPPL